MTNTATQKQHHARLYLGLWNLYFIVKIALYSQGLIDLHVLENFALMLYLLWPIAHTVGFRLKQITAIPAALALLYYDSWLPPIGRLISRLPALSQFSGTYWLELTTRIMNPQLIAGFVILFIGYMLLRSYIRFAPLVTIALLGIAIQQQLPKSAEQLASAPPPENPVKKATQTAQASSENKNDLSAQLQAFYQQQAQLKVKFPQLATGAPAFDLVFIHICSLSWDDLVATGLHNHPLWQDFDIVFRNFNTAASYSGPAAIRLSRASCGQTPHNALYQPVAPDCYLFDNLQKAGFTLQTALNHDGHFDDFLPLLKQQKLPAPIVDIRPLPAPLRAFDDSKIYDDFTVLQQWHKQRVQNNTERIALYYNSVSLHDGNISLARKELSSLQSYTSRLKKLLDDVQTNLSQWQATGRPMVVILVPEHGAALRGDKMQFSGLREIPTPAITQVPVGVKVLGTTSHRLGEQAIILQPSSYSAISQLVAEILRQSPFSTSNFDPARYTQNLSSTPFVAENESNIILESQQKYFLQQNRAAWQVYQP